MNKDNAKDFLPLVQALADGKTIQHRPHDKAEWRDMGMGVAFGGYPWYYRIKPEPPVELEIWYKKSKDGTISYSTYRPGGDERVWEKAGYKKITLREVVED